MSAKARASSPQADANPDAHGDAHDALPAHAHAHRIDDPAGHFDPAAVNLTGSHTILLEPDGHQRLLQHSAKHEHSAADPVIYVEHSAHHGYHLRVDDRLPLAVLVGRADSRRAHHSTLHDDHDQRRSPGAGRTSRLNRSDA